jgi:isoleucyl-tRNA synthetase
MIQEFIDDLSTWYLRRSRGRKDEAFFGTFRQVLLTTAKIIAPFMPYLAEKIYRSLNVRDEIPSVHLADWPERRNLTDDEKKLFEDMAKVRTLASIGMALRKEANFPVRQPLNALWVKNPDMMPNDAELLRILKDELNVNDVAVSAGIETDAALDTELSPELRLAGLVRGLERSVQELRKKNGLNVGEMAELLWHADDAEMRQAITLINKEKTYIASINEDSSAKEPVVIDGKTITLGIRKV